jgi:hypothetical protein
MDRVTYTDEDYFQHDDDTYEEDMKKLASKPILKKNKTNTKDDKK